MSVCVASIAPASNQLVALVVSATRNTLNDPRTPPQAAFLERSATEQFVSVGPDFPSPFQSPARQLLLLHPG